MRERLTPELEALCVALGLGVIGLLALNFTLSHDLELGSRIRFVVSGSLLGLVALFFRFALREVKELHRAAYRIATTFMLWSLAYALVPYPGTFLYLLVLPAFYFLYRIEVKEAGKEGLKEDQVAAGILLAIGAGLYFEQQPLQVVLFPGSPFDWQDYYRNAPVLAMVGLGFLRLNRRIRWTGLATLGAVFVLVAAVLGAAWLSDDVTRPPLGTVEAIYVILFAHLALAFVFFKNPVARVFFRFSGLEDEHRKGFQSQLYWLLNAALQLTLVPLILLSADWVFLGVALAVPLASLYLYRRFSVSVALVELALLFFPMTLLVEPALHPRISSVALAGLLGVMVVLRRSHPLAATVPNLTWIACSVVYVASLLHQGVLSPVGLVFILVGVAAWLALPGRPLRPSPESYYLVWPPAMAVVLLCLNRGYDSLLLPLWALTLVGIPVLAYGLLSLLVHWGWGRWGRRGFSTTLSHWLLVAPVGLERLTFVALVVLVVSFVLDYAEYVGGWFWTVPALVTLAVGASVHLGSAIRRKSLLSAFFAEAHLWILLGLVRFKLETLERMELGHPVDGYLLLGFAFLVAGLREVLRRNTQVFDTYLARSSLIYGLLGWVYTVWLQLTDGDTFHGETGSLLVAALYYWFSVTRRKGNVIPAFVFLNIASVLFFFRLEATNPQFYVLPAVSSVLIVAQLFKRELAPTQMRRIRLGCSLILVGASTFYNVIDFNESLYYPLVAALVAAVGVVVGISLQVRIYLFVGLSSFVVNTVAVLVHVVRNQPPSQIKLIVGVVFLVVGLVFTGSFLLFQVKRQQILNQYAWLRRELAGWD